MSIEFYVCLRVRFKSVIYKMYMIEVFQISISYNNCSNYSASYLTMIFTYDPMLKEHENERKITHSNPFVIK